MQISPHKNRGAGSAACATADKAACATTYNSEMRPLQGRVLLFDIGNTNTHVGLASHQRIQRHTDIPTASWTDGQALRRLRDFVSAQPIQGICVCSVVPSVTPHVILAAKQIMGPDRAVVLLSPATLRQVGIDYPKPWSIGQDRLANALAAKLKLGAPALVVDFGTAVTFDVVDPHGNYVGGIIAPGLAVMTDYLHEKTALLPRIQIRDQKGIIGRSTEEAMRIGAVHGYRGLVRELIIRVKKELGVRRLPVIATGGYARLMAKGIREITHIEPLLTLEGLRLHWLDQTALPRSGG